MTAVPLCLPKRAQRSRRRRWQRSGRNTARRFRLPKLMATANFWVQMEIAETKIWEGENVSDVLKDLSEKIMTQVTGTQYVEEEYIEVPTETQIDYAEGEEE